MNSILSVIENKINIEESNIPETPYIYNGYYVPRVTSILSDMLHEEHLMSWANYMGFKRQNSNSFKEDAATKGTYTHNFIEQYISNSIEPDYSTVEEQFRQEVKNAFTAFSKWWNILISNNEIEVIMQEQPLVCPYFGGTLDLLLKINGKIYLFDFKTSNHPSFKYFLQLSAYRYILKINYNIDLDGCGILMLNKKTANFEEIFIPFYDTFYLQYINKCQETFFSLVYSYYNRLYIENMYKEVLKRQNGELDISYSA